jgi:hypothetical protein
MTVLAAMLYTLFGSADADGSGFPGGLVWLVVGILAIIALIIYIVGRGRRW